MTRKPKPRRVGFMPNATYFKPRGIPLSTLEEEVLTVDELEALRLTDVEQLEQTKAAKKMQISQSTLQRILTKAHQKVSTALTMGRAIKIEGGAYIMQNSQQPTGGRGRMGGPVAGGPDGTCICTNPDCKAEVPHQTGVPCSDQKCPKCGSSMTRKA